MDAFKFEAFEATSSHPLVDALMCSFLKSDELQKKKKILMKKKIPDLIHPSFTGPKRRIMSSLVAGTLILDLR